MEEDGETDPFRYNLKCRPMVSCFEPKTVSSAANQALRASMFGAFLVLPPSQQQDPNATNKFGLGKLPDSDNCKVVWEATARSGLVVIRSLRLRFE